MVAAPWQFWRGKTNHAGTGVKRQEKSKSREPRPSRMSLNPALIVAGNCQRRDYFSLP
jgi:hypothetical protein